MYLKKRLVIIIHKVRTAIKPYSQSEAERETLSNQMMEDRSQLVAERTALREEQEQLKLNREAAARDREKLEAYGAEIQQRSQEIEQITEVLFCTCMYVCTCTGTVNSSTIVRSQS